MGDTSHQGNLFYGGRGGKTPKNVDKKLPQYIFYDLDQDEYKVLCVGDGRKVAMITFIFEDGLNATSAANVAR